MTFASATRNRFMERTNPAEPTPEMVEFFERRTKEHIERVGHCLMLLADLGGHDQMLQRARDHDASKFGPEERTGYIWLTEYHRCRRAGQAFEYPPGINDLVKLAVRHHVTTNRHHPEFHDDPNDMSDVDLMEMVCDWTAMAQEFGEADGSARGWADRTIGRLKFSEERRQFIYRMIRDLEERTRS